jgi:PHD/YefM family antitoxin component YafN of YafNO toxin-antitoxin module
MPTITPAQARKSFTATLARVTVGRERIIVERDGKAVAAIVPVEDLELLDRLVGEIEDRALAEMALERERSAKARGDRPVPWRRVRKDLGL